jgi:hypothetical protein
LIIAVRVSPYAACFTKAELFFELMTVFFRRAGGLTAKVAALPDSRFAGGPPALRRRKKDRPARAGFKGLKKMAEQQAAYGETWPASGKTKRRHVKTLTKILWPRRVAEGPKHTIRASGRDGRASWPALCRKPARRVLSRLAGENFKAVSGTERLAWPPARERGAQISGQAKKRSGAADLKF